MHPSSFFALFQLLLCTCFSCFCQNNHQNESRQFQYIITVDESGADSLEEEKQKLIKVIEDLNSARYRKVIREVKRKIRKSEKQDQDLQNWYLLQIMAYSNLGEEAKTEKTFAKAFAELQPSFLLYYNYALKKMWERDYLQADQFVQQSIQLNSAFAPSHLLLSEIQKMQGRRIKAILPLYAYFLFEDEDNAEQKQISKLRHLLYKGINVVQSNGLTFTLPYSREEKENGFLELEILLNDLQEQFQNGSSKEHRMAVYTKAVFGFVGYQPLQKEDIWWSFYGEIFGEIAKKNLIEAFVYTELEQESANSTKFYLRHHNKVEEYLEWRENL